VPGRIGEHRLEALARHTLALAASLGLAARGAQAVDKLVAGALECGDVDEATGFGGGERLALRGSGGLGMSREAPLEPGDLVAQCTAGRRLVAALEGRRLEDLEVGRAGVAARVEHTRQVAGVDAGVAGCIGGGGRELLDSRHRGTCGDEGPLALARGHEPLRLEPTVDGTCGIGVHSHVRSEVANARQAVAGGEAAADDQRSQTPGEVDPHGKVVAAIQLHLP
jgi:hypothetical protein